MGRSYQTLQRRTENDVEGELNQRMPPALSRAPDSTLETSREALDSKVLSALNSVAHWNRRMIRSCGGKQQARYFDWYLFLQSMATTHRSIVSILKASKNERSLAKDVVPLARLQIERVFVSMLLYDNPDRWERTYRKNAWKYVAFRFWRNARWYERLPELYEDYAPDGDRAKFLMNLAQQWEVSDEEQLAECKWLNGESPDKQSRIPQFPNAGQTIGHLYDAMLKMVCTVVYPTYNDLCHLAHGGLGSLMVQAIFSDDFQISDRRKAEQFSYSEFVEDALIPASVAAAFCATLFGLAAKSDETTMQSLLSA